MTYITYSVDVSERDEEELFTKARRWHCISCDGTTQRLLSEEVPTLDFVFKLESMYSDRFTAMGRGHWKVHDML